MVDDGPAVFSIDMEDWYHGVELPLPQTQSRYAAPIFPQFCLAGGALAQHVFDRLAKTRSGETPA